MSFDATEDYIARVLKEEQLPVATGDPSKWVVVHDAPGPASRRVSSTGPGTLFTVAWVLGTTLALIWVLRNGWTVFDQWQENVYRRANRRRHGIPDDDDRPFNVAYAAAALMRRQREEEEKKRAEEAGRAAPRVVPKWTMHGDSRGMRQPFPQQTLPVSAPQHQPPLLQDSSANNLGNKSVHFSPEENSTHHAQHHSQIPTDSRNARSRLSENVLEDHAGHPQLPADSSRRDQGSRERRKRQELGETDDEYRSPKKSRKTVRDKEGNHDAAWANMPGNSQHGFLQIPKRGSKRHANEEADDDWEMSQDKRARKGSLAQFPAAEDSDMEVDGRDAQLPRGTKRDRGDVESVADGAPYDSDAAIASRPTRKRRSSREDGSIPPKESSRGRKRDRSPERSAPSGGEGEESNEPMERRKRGRRLEQRDEDTVIPNQRSVSSGGERGKSNDLAGSRLHAVAVGANRKRGRRLGLRDEDSSIINERSAVEIHRRDRRLEQRDNDTVILDEASDSEAEVSSDPACGGRRMGETWEVNGQSFKVGLDGRRLRHALIKQRRTMFSMPKDSAHIDAWMNMDVMVEKWLNDEEYNAAKERHELAWQVVSPSSTLENSQIRARQQEPPSLSGKRLLWGGPSLSPVNGRPLTRSASNVQNPFDLAPNNAGRRVSSAQVLQNNKIESPKLLNSKTFSKWEKQELEAKSLKKMRERIEKEKADAAAAAAATAKSSATTAPTSTTNTQTKSSSLPTNQALPKPTLPSSDSQSTTLTNVLAKPSTNSATSSSASLSFGKLSSTSSNIIALPKSAVPQNSAVPSAASSKPSFTFSAPLAASTTSPSTPAQTITQKPSFSFGLPGAVQPSTPGAPPPPASKPSFSFGTPTSETNKSDAAKQLPFSFGAGTQSTELTKSGIPNFFAQPASQAPSGDAGATATFDSTNAGSFGFSSAPQTAQSKPPPKSTFTFGKPGGQKNDALSSAGAGSLLSRLGPVQGSSQAQSGAAPVSWSSPFGGGQTSSPFGNPNPSQPPSSNIFGQPQSQSTSQTPFGQGTSKPTLFGSGATSGPDTTKSNAFAASSSQGQKQNTSKPTIFGAAAFSGPGATKNSAFAAPSSQGQEQSTSKPTIFGAAAFSGPGATKNSAFAAPSSQGQEQSTSKPTIFGAAAVSGPGATKNSAFAAPSSQGQEQSTSKPTIFGAAAVSGPGATKNSAFAVPSSQGQEQSTSELTIFGAAAVSGSGATNNAFAVPSSRGQEQSTNKPTTFGVAAISGSDTTKSNPFAVQSPQGQEQGARKPSLFGASAISGSDTTKNNPFALGSSQGQEQSASKPSLFGAGTISGSDTTQSNPFAAPSSQGRGQSADRPSFFGAGAISGSDTTKSNFFAASSSQGQEQSASKPALFGAGGGSGFDAAKNNPFALPPSAAGDVSSGSDTTTKNIFAAPSSTAGGAKSVFSIPKPPGQGDAPTGTTASAFSFPKAQPEQQTDQSKPSVGFNFGASSKTTDTGSAAPANPLNPPSAPSAEAPAQSGGFAFPPGKTSTPDQSPFTGFGSKPAESEKK